MSKAQVYYREGRLQEAITAATDEVRQYPADRGRRAFLCELLCLAGDLEHADHQLDTLGRQEPDIMVGISLFRQVLRAEQARQQFYADGRLPELLDQPPPALKLLLEASIRLREGRPADAAGLLARAEERRPRVAGACDGTTFDDLRDLDDRTASVVEVLTSKGQYYWVPLERVELIEFRPPARPRDLLWRRAHLVVRDGPDSEVFLPTLYPGSQAEPDDRFRLGRATEWRGGDGTPTRGVGQRTLLVGGEARPILEIKEIAVTTVRASC
jgi:type VI secretion system protein ImpE